MEKTEEGGRSERGSKGSGGMNMGRGRRRKTVIGLECMLRGSVGEW